MKKKDRRLETLSSEEGGFADGQASKTVIGHDLAVNAEDHSYRGCVEVFDNGKIMGWVVDLDEPWRPIELTVELGGGTLIKTSTRIERSDISDLVAGSLTAGFLVDLGSLSEDEAGVAVTALAQYDQMELPFDQIFKLSINKGRHELRCLPVLKNQTVLVSSLVKKIESGFIKGSDFREFDARDVSGGTLDGVKPSSFKKGDDQPFDTRPAEIFPTRPFGQDGVESFLRGEIAELGSDKSDIRENDGILIRNAGVPEPRSYDAAPIRHPDAHLVDGLFDVDFYQTSFLPEDRPSDPSSHYLTLGYLQGRDPAPWFSGWHYLALNADVAEAKMNPFLHYCIAGKNEGRPLARLGADSEGDLYGAHAFAVAPGPHFEEFDPNIGIGRRKRAKVMAYYLPQFHAVEVNDRTWGTGFTEWRNLPRALPRFMGHVQPRIPRDLGCYDLSEGDVMRRQIDMARAAGLEGFCFYHYWFDGRRVLETPMERLLADPTLDFPFCLMWANENWSRAWDGADKEIILQQSYRPQDDRAFVADIARHMIDPRYMRLGNRPVLFIYRPANIPSATETLQRWRRIFSDEHGLKPFIMMAQGFGDEDPRAFGLDGAIEFPPHKICQDQPSITHTLALLDRDYSGHVLSYDTMVQRSSAEQAQPFPLIRTVTPTWDNEARRPGRGMILHGSTPAKFGAWLNDMIGYARANPVEGTPLVCVNAWNEWAEGAVLEPDVHYGAGFLNAVSRAVHGVAQREARKPRKVLIVGHDANRNGAQVLALQIGRMLRRVCGVEVCFILCGAGPMLDEYRSIGAVHLLDDKRTGSEGLVKSLLVEGYAMAITNTTPCGEIAPLLKKCGLSVVSLVHELPNLLKSLQLENAARAIARHSDHVVFPAEVVRQGFETFVGRVEGEVVVQPQGLWNVNVLDKARGDDGLRAELGLPGASRIVLGVGYADLRKGIDRFVATAMAMCSRHNDVVFLWVGPPSQETLNWFLPEISASGFEDRIRMASYTEDLARYYGAADVFYLASREDPFPSVVLEALAAGLPIVGHGGTGGCDDLIARHGILVAQSDPQGASAAIETLLTRNDPDQLHAARKARRDEVVQNYRFDDYVFGLMQRLSPEVVSVSAVVPNYNYEAFIGERLRTVFDQTYPLKEVVVLDDASPDNSAAVIRATAGAAGRDIALHVNATNSGSPFPQWRKGVDLARGDYVWIAEADDLATPDFVGRLIDRMRQADSVLGFTDSAQIDETGAPLGPSYRPYMNEIESGVFDTAFDMDGPAFLSRFLSVKNVILNVSGVIFRRDALLDAFASVGEALYDYRVAGDWRLYAEICGRKGSRVSYLPDALNTHRRHQVSVTHALNVDKHLEEIKAMQRLVGDLTSISKRVKAAQSAYISSARRHLTTVHSTIGAE